jgi:FkbM family methyltransferase
MMEYAFDSRLVADLGMNNGDDTGFYLRKGFKVVALEANPGLCRNAETRFADAISQGSLAIVNAAIWDQSGEVTFHVNLDNDHWSSIETGWAGRDNSRMQPITVRSMTLDELFAEHGVPYYLKIDVEGVDLQVLEQLNSLSRLPARVSVEDCRFGFQYLDILASAGYNGFKLLDQSTVPELRDETSGAAFPKGASGPLGDEISGAWLSHDDIVALYASTVRDHEGNRIADRTHWWDIHAARL